MGTLSCLFACTTSVLHNGARNSMHSTLRPALALPCLGSDKILLMQVAQSYGLLLGTIVMVPKTAQTMAAILMLTFVLTGGYFVRGVLPCLLVEDRYVSQTLVLMTCAVAVPSANACQ